MRASLAQSLAAATILLLVARVHGGQCDYSDAFSIQHTVDCGPGSSLPCENYDAGCCNYMYVAKRCTSCLPGTYSTGPQNTACTACPAGTFSTVSAANNAGVCTDCVPGTYSSAGATSCLGSPCTPGTTGMSRATSATAAACNIGSPCPPGSYGMPGNVYGSCSFCSAGTFSTSFGSSSCSPCPPGTDHSLNNLTECPPCPKYTFSAANGQPCLHCSQPGSIPVSPYSSSCYGSEGALCPLGLVCPGSGLPPFPSPGGYITTYQGSSSLSSLTACPPGTYSLTGNITCTPCAAGFYSQATAANSSDTCSPCGAGMFSPPGSYRCFACPAGTWSANSTAASVDDCVSCSLGSASAAVGAQSLSTCVPCLPGSFAHSQGMVACVPCSPGFFSNSSNSSSCDQCPSGSFSAQGALSCARSRIVADSVMGVPRTTSPYVGPGHSQGPGGPFVTAFALGLPASHVPVAIDEAATLYLAPRQPGLVLTLPLPDLAAQKRLQVAVQIRGVASTYPLPNLTAVNGIAVSGSRLLASSPSSTSPSYNSRLLVFPANAAAASENAVNSTSQLLDISNNGLGCATSMFVVGNLTFAVVPYTDPTVHNVLSDANFAACQPSMQNCVYFALILRASLTYVVNNTAPSSAIDATIDGAVIAVRSDGLLAVLGNAILTSCYDCSGIPRCPSSSNIAPLPPYVSWDAPSTCNSYWYSIRLSKLKVMCAVKAVDPFSRNETIVAWWASEGLQLPYYPYISSSPSCSSLAAFDERDGSLVVQVPSGAYIRVEATSSIQVSAAIESSAAPAAAGPGYTTSPDSSSSATPCSTAKTSDPAYLSVFSTTADVAVWSPTNAARTLMVTYARNRIMAVTRNDSVAWSFDVLGCAANFFSCPSYCVLSSALLCEAPSNNAVALTNLITAADGTVYAHFAYVSSELGGVIFALNGTSGAFVWSFKGYQGSAAPTGMILAPDGTLWVTCSGVLFALVPCPTGVACSASATSARCAPGSANPLVAQSACVPCAPGSFAELAGQTACTPCPAGTWSAESGSTTRSSCVACSPGSYSAALGASGAASCTLCPAGTASTAPGAASNASCVPCAGGFWSGRSL